MKRHVLATLVFVAALLLVTSYAHAAERPRQVDELANYYFGTIQSISKNSITIKTIDPKIIKKAELINKDSDSESTTAEQPSARSFTERLNQVINEQRTGREVRLRSIEEKVGKISKKVDPVTVTVMVNPALIANRLLNTGSRVLFSGSYDAKNNVLIADRVLDTKGTFIKRSR